MTASTFKLDAYSDAPPTAPLNLLFIHHSVGGQWLAEPGSAETTTDARYSLLRTHPNGGGLRTLLASQGYRIHEASYGSEVGQRTDLFDWLPKFRDSMPRILATRWQDEALTTGINHVVMFKSCYPNNAFRPDGTSTSDGVPALTLTNARATFSELLAQLAKYPEVLFIYVTAPPLRDDSAMEPIWRSLAKRMLARQSLAAERRHSAALARAFNDWIASPAGWLARYPHRNVVFDYFGLLAGDDDFLRCASNGGTDNHPKAEAQQLAAARFAPFVNRAVRYAGLSS
jgi:hypothetical protein